MNETDKARVEYMDKLIHVLGELPPSLMWALGKETGALSKKIADTISEMAAKYHGTQTQ